MTLLSRDAITILRELGAAAGPIERPEGWSSSAWWELVGEGLARTEPHILDTTSIPGRRSRREGELEQDRAALRRPARVGITPRGRERLRRLEAGRRRRAG